MPHGPDTFLPPLLDSTTGEEVTFIYEAYVQPIRNSAARLSNPTYGSWEMTDLLVKQYPPLFHAAANIPSFIRAFSATPNLKHLRVSCPGQESAQRYRRSTVDYALISLRIAAERSKLSDLDTLSLISIHPGALLYLNPSIGYGALPNSARVWRQIRKLAIHMDCMPFSLGVSTDHLKLLHAYLQLFSSSVGKFVFRWNGNKGPCPLSLGTEPCMARSSPALACPRRCHLSLRPLRFDKLRYMEVENAVMDASQISSFITNHRRSIHEFNFEDSSLRSGTWDEALAPLTRISGSEKWKEKTEEVMDVPLVLSPVGLDKGQMDKVLQEHSRHRHPTLSRGGWQKASAKDAFPSSVAFDAINSSLKSDDAERKDAVNKGKAVFAFTLKNTAGETESWYIDLKEKGEVAKGDAPEGKKADVTLSLSDEDFGKLVAGKTQAQRLFMSGKLKIKGDVMKATKMEPVLKKAQTKAKL
ncbi:hypothetical protein MMC06_004346 [Schaereria dolodes]|nr:hypothetical protein [Schaereria dolodes]